MRLLSALALLITISNVNGYETDPESCRACYKKGDVSCMSKELDTGFCCEQSNQVC